MDILVEVSTEFELTADEIAHGWNSQSSHTAIAIARPGTQRMDDFDAGLVDSVGVILGTLGSGIAVNAVYDLLKSLLRRGRPEREITFTEIDRPDGTKIVRVSVSGKK